MARPCGCARPWGSCSSPAPTSSSPAAPIEGHSDSDQIRSLSFPDNLALSKARAKTVADLIGRVLSNPGRISVEGFGESRPIASNDTPDGKALNRRVEIVIPRHQ
ncbi:MAG: OmpA family protein [Novosphingobium sp.]|nr:OmpA family protein [Novosphingobium sp.]